MAIFGNLSSADLAAQCFLEKSWVLYHGIIHNGQPNCSLEGIVKSSLQGYRTS